MGLLLHLSNLMRPGRAWRGGLDDELHAVHVELVRSLRSAPAVVLQVEADGSLVCGHERIEARSAPDQGLGRALRRSGVRGMSFRRGLEALDLARFFSALTMFAGTPISDEHDLVTFWFEQGSPGIELEQTELSTSYLPLSAREPLPELALLGRLLGGRDGVAALRAAADTDEEELVVAPEPVSLEVRSLLEERFGGALRDETTQSLRRSALHSAMAALSAHLPALSESELSRVLLRLLRDAMRDGEFELVRTNIDHLERLADPAAPVRERVHTIAAGVLVRMRSVDWLVDLVHACVGSTRIERLDRLVGWLLERDAEALLHATLSTLDPSQISYAVAVFAVHFGTRDPFWQTTLGAAGLSRPQRAAVRRALASLETLLGLDDTRPPLSRDTFPGIAMLRSRSTVQVRAVDPDDTALDETSPGDRLSDPSDLLDDPRFIDDLDDSLLELIRRRSALGLHG